MTSSQDTDDRLRAAFRSLSADGRIDCSKEELERVWRAVSGELPADERHEVVDRMATQPAVAEAWRSRTSCVPRSRRRLRSSAETSGAILGPAWIGLAALLVLSVGVGAGAVTVDPPTDTFRDAGPLCRRAARDVRCDAFARSHSCCVGKPAPDGSRYQVTVTTDDLRGPDDGDRLDLAGADGSARAALRTRAGRARLVASRRGSARRRDRLVARRSSFACSNDEPKRADASARLCALSERNGTKMSRTTTMGLGLLLVGMLAGAAGVHAVQSLRTPASFLNSGLFTLAAGEAGELQCDTRRPPRRPTGQVLMQLLDAKGAVVARQDTSWARTVRHSSIRRPGVFRAQAEILEPERAAWHSQDCRQHGRDSWNRCRWRRPRALRAVARRRPIPRRFVLQ